MKRFDGTCPACGSRDVKMLYEPEFNHLRCECGQCQYMWNAAPLYTADAIEEPQPEADAEQVICDGASHCDHTECIHRIQHGHFYMCNARCYLLKTAHLCIPVSQPEAQPEPPLPMKLGEQHPASRFVGLRRSEHDLRYWAYNPTLADLTPSGSWSDWLTLARWIIEQEEERHALPRSV